MKLGSLFDGSGGFPLAGSMSGVEPVWAAEIEPFPIRVTKKRFPHMKHLGDINKINGAEIEPVDIICGGSPCQGMSLAGQREGLNDSRSILFYQMIRVIKEMHEATNGEYPRYIVWENVIGSFSSNNGDDFRCVLEEFCRVKESSVHIPRPKKWEPAGYVRGNGYSLAWRVYDAQYWGRTIVTPTGELVQRGTPQRRKRIYLVVDLAGERADRILFDRESVSGYSYQSEEQRQGATVVAEDSIGRSGCIGVDKAVAFMGGQGSKAGSLGCSVDVYPTIRAAQSGSNSIPNVCYEPKWFSVNGYAEYVNKPPVLRASGGDMGGGTEALIVQLSDAWAMGNCSKLL